METDNIIIYRDELYKEVWSIPFIKLTQKYNVTNHLLMKICKQIGVPIPTNGYWSKLRYGRKAA